MTHTNARGVVYRKVYIVPINRESYSKKARAPARTEGGVRSTETERRGRMRAYERMLPRSRCSSALVHVSPFARRLQHRRVTLSCPQTRSSSPTRLVVHTVRPLAALSALLGSTVVGRLRNEDSLAARWLDDVVGGLKGLG